MQSNLEEVLRNVPGWLTIEEAVMIFELARDSPAEGTVVELGSYLGRSTICLALGVSERKDKFRSVISVDPHTGSEEHQPGAWAFKPETLNQQTGVIDTLPLFRANISRFGVSDIVEIWMMTSLQAAAHCDDKVRLLFVDADHREEAVYADIVAWKEKLSEHGYVVLHDVGSWPGPTAVAERLIASGQFWPVLRAGTALALSVSSSLTS
jgi:MMP 1-O-methyltransferase